MPAVSGRTAQGNRRSGHDRRRAAEGTLATMETWIWDGVASAAKLWRYAKQIRHGGDRRRR